MSYQIRLYRNYFSFPSLCALCVWSGFLTIQMLPDLISHPVYTGFSRNKLSILWDGLLARPILVAGETPAPQEIFYFFLLLIMLITAPAAPQSTASPRVSLPGRVIAPTATPDAAPTATS
jgi:hypothetical protein